MKLQQQALSSEPVSGGLSMSHQDEVCSFCALIRTLYPEGIATDEKAAILVREHFRIAHGVLLRPMELAGISEPEGFS